MQIYIVLMEYDKIFINYLKLTPLRIAIIQLIEENNF